MKVKTSITISEDILIAMDRIIQNKTNRSRFIELALRNYIQQQYRLQRDITDSEILNKNSKKFNSEAEDTLEYQAQRH